MVILKTKEVILFSVKQKFKNPYQNPFFFNGCLGHLCVGCAGLQIGAHCCLFLLEQTQMKNLPHLQASTASS